MKRAVLAAVATLAIALNVHSATAAALSVMVEFQAFAPDSLDALPGDAVTWTNNSGRRHTVTADHGEFDSGSLFDGSQFSQTFGATGTYIYHCTVHPGMVGEIDVRRITLDALPPAAVLARSTVELDGRTADPSVPVRVERDTGTGFRTVAAVSPRADGTWHATVIATRTARLRAAAGADVSETRQLSSSTEPCICG